MTIASVILAALACAELPLYISNHDQLPLRRVVHQIVGRTNVVYDANGALELVEGEALAFYVKDSANVTIRNVRIDYARPCMTEARVARFDGGKTVVSIDAKRFPCVMKDGCLEMSGPGWTNAVCAARVFDGVTGVQIPGVPDIPFDGKASLLADGTVELEKDFSGFGIGVKPGDVIVLRPRRRPYPAIFVDGSRDVVLEDVVVHDACGMALVAQRSENVSWRGTKPPGTRTSGVFPREGCYASTHADATHFSNVKGLAAVENCLFSGMMDDAINVHSTCLSIQKVLGQRSIRCRYMHPQAVGFDVFRPGETLRFIRGPTLENGPVCKVAGVVWHDAREVTLTLDSVLPDGFGEGDAVENADWQPAVVFRGNVVCNNRARGALFTTPHPVLVESNVFHDVTGCAILFAGDSSYWYESGACRDVAIRHNVFSNCCTAASNIGFSKGILSFYPSIRNLGSQKAFYHGGIVIEDNAFYTFDVPLLFAISTENLVWRRNKVVYDGSLESWGKPPFIAIRCRDIAVDGKPVADTPPPRSCGLL